MKMPEAEVSLRLAIHLIENNLTISDVDVAIDGAQVKTTNTIHFAISEFLATIGWKKAKDDAVWQGEYRHEKHDRKIRIHSRSGCGDVVATLSNGKILRVESKKGSLSTSKSSKEYPLLREAMGQILTYTEAGRSCVPGEGSQRWHPWSLWSCDRFRQLRPLSARRFRHH